MLGAPLEGLEDEHVEGALKDFDSIAVGIWLRSHCSRQSTSSAVGCLLPEEIRRRASPGLFTQVRAVRAKPEFPVRCPSKQPLVRISLRKAAWSAPTSPGFAGNSGNLDWIRKEASAMLERVLR